jgi:raffinose/stachyose/melibiose transport system substrate-binding protein
MADVDIYEKLSLLVEDMTLHKEALGINGVFASISFAAGEDWRWQTHLANIPVYYEFEDKGISDSPTLGFTYAQNYKNIFDLYINYSCTDRTSLHDKRVDDSMKEFALGRKTMFVSILW